MKNLKNVLLVLSGIMLIIFQTSCDKNNTKDPDPDNEEELITTLKLTFDDGNTALSYQFQDLDGEGGDNPTIDTIFLKKDTTYSVSLKVLNESVTPAEDITLEVEKEKDEHLFCYTPNNSDISISLTDSDGTYPIGITSNWKATAIGQNGVKVVLKHQPEIKNGSCDVGETDIEVNFVVIVE